MKNDCVILKKKEYDKLVEKANANEPDYIRLNIVVTNFNRRLTDIPDSYIIGELQTSLPLSGGLQSQILNIKNTLEKKINKNLEYWEDRVIRKRKHEENTDFRLFEQHITNDLEEIIREVPIWSLRKEITGIWRKLVLSKYYEYENT